MAPPVNRVIRPPPIDEILPQPSPSPEIGQKVDTLSYLSLFKRKDNDRSLHKRMKYVLQKIDPKIRMLPDDSGRFIYLDSMETSFSPLHNLLEFFLIDDGTQEIPVDAAAFLGLLKSLKIPAEYLRYVTR